MSPDRRTPPAADRPVRLGDHVRDPYGHRGRVYAVHPYGCPHGDAWLAGQQLDVSGYRDRAWVSLLVDGGGAVTTPAALTEPVAPFDVDHPSIGLYFHPTPTVEDPRGCRYLLRSVPDDNTEGADTADRVIAFVETAILSGDATAVEVRLADHVLTDRS